MTAARDDRPGAGRGRLAIAALALLSLVAACGTSVTPSVPGGGACAVDVPRAPGTFPDLERLLPLGMIEASPTTLDSGANCTRASLGSYVGHGVGELRFAGATWDYGGGEATVVAVFATPAGQPTLEAAWVEEFYTAGAVAGRTIDDVTTTRPVMRGAGQVFRLEVINNLSLQTVVVWPAEPYVRVVIVATNVEPGASRADHDQRVETAVEVAAAVPVP